MDYNLDDCVDCKDFLNKFGAPSTGLMPRDKARELLSDKRPGYIVTATRLRDYAWNARTAFLCRKEGKISEALRYEAICQHIYQTIPEDLRWQRPNPMLKLRSETQRLQPSTTRNSINVEVALDDQEQQRFDVAIALVRTTKKAAIAQAIMAWVERIEQKEKEQQ